jgi:hypothetical protein
MVCTRAPEVVSSRTHLGLRGLSSRPFAGFGEHDFLVIGDRAC